MYEINSISKKIILLIVMIYVGEVYSLKFTNMSVPELVKPGENVTLICEYDIENEPLLSVKWYYQRFEFYRYDPHQKPEKKYFPLRNFKVDVSNSNANKIILIDVRPEQSGRYSCEVTTDAPFFYSISKESNMTVSKTPVLEKVNISVPETVTSNQDVTLLCDHNLGNETLYYVKWYWNAQEFYRYQPKMVPNKIYFRLPHFKVDITSSGPSKVTLKNIQPEQSGSYSCEVSTEAPHFNTYKKDATMIVTKF